uniref:Uncharacterized protein n=1 Tax=Arundo donax TaxID=35708 RepID=A0A0A9ASE4_ARUDO
MRSLHFIQMAKDMQTSKKKVFILDHICNLRPTQPLYRLLNCQFQPLHIASYQLLLPRISPLAGS